MDVGEFLSTKRGGAPTYVWVGVGVFLVAAVVLYMRQKNKSAAAQSNTDGAGSVTSIPTGGAAYPVPFTGGDVFVNQPAPVPQNTENIPTALSQLQLGTYIVKDVQAPQGARDTTPNGVAQIVYGLNPNDTVNVAVDTTEIALLNPQAGPIPWAKGTAIKYPVVPETLATPAAVTSSTTLPSVTATGAPPPSVPTNIFGP